MLGAPRSGSKVCKALDREITDPGENRGQIVASWELQPAAAFHDRQTEWAISKRNGLTAG